MIWIIGAGGVGSWLTPSLCRLAGRTNVTVVDGDRFEVGNIDRQLFKLANVGHNKAWVLADMYRCFFREEFYRRELLPLQRGDVLMVCADNNNARLEALADADQRCVRVIIAANETTSAEAYYYEESWKETGRDPRQFYRLEPDHNDPRARAAGCAAAAEAAPQLVSANFMAAGLAQWLYVLWIMKRPSPLPSSLKDMLPNLLRANFSRLESLATWRDML